MAPYNPRLGQYGAPQATGFSPVSDMIHQVRQWADAHTPGPIDALSLALGPAGGALGAIGPRAMPAAWRGAVKAASTYASLPDVFGGPRAPNMNPRAGGGVRPPEAPYPQGTDPMTAGLPAAPSYPAVDPMAGHASPGPAVQTARPTLPNPQVPLPQARPAEAPQPEPDTSFFMRNAMMMRDPTSGDFIDPTGAASVRGPDLINKMMGYLHNKVS